MSMIMIMMEDGLDDHSQIVANGLGLVLYHETKVVNYETPFVL